MKPQQIGKYRIERELGKGGMGVVYLGFDPILNRQVAIKMIAPQYLEDEEAQSRFLREARVVANFQHQNIVSVFEFGKEEETGAPYIVMEYVDGLDLKRLIKDRVLIPFEKKLDLIVQICHGLHYSHEHDILHRDIKPGNILVRKDGSAHIVDFGLARIRSSDMTQSGLMGTPDYMSPEQATGIRELDRRSDLFSLGIVLYEFISLSRPFDGDTPWQMLSQITSHPHRSLSAVLPGCDEELAQIVNKALEKNPSARFANCLELAESLNAFRRSLPEGQAALRRTVVRLRTKFTRLNTPQRLEDLFDGFLFGGEPVGGQPGTVCSIDFGPIDSDNDYGCLLLELAKLKKELEAIAAKLKAAQGLRSRFIQARERFEYGKLEECLALLEGILLSYPGSTEASTLRRECLRLLEERGDPALRTCFVKAAVLEAQEALEKGNTERAKRAVSRALQTEPGVLEALQIERQVLSAEELERRIQALLEDAQSAFEEKRFETCLQFVKEGLALAPEHSELSRFRHHAQHELEIHTLIQLAKTESSAKRWRSAKRALTKVLRLDSSQAEALLLKEQLERHRKIQMRKAWLSTIAVGGVAVIWLWFSTQSRIPARETYPNVSKQEEQPTFEPERAGLAEAKNRAAVANAGELSPDTYQRALTLEREAMELESRGLRSAAGPKVAAARDAYYQSEREAKEARRQRELLSRQKDQAQRAMQAYAAGKEAADKSGAADLDGYRKGLNHASSGQVLWDRSNFVAAEKSFEMARQAMEASLSEIEAQRLKQDQEVIAQLIDRFEAALNRKDLSAVKVLWPLLPQAEEQRMRAELGGQSFSLRVQKEKLPVVRGDRATLACLFSKEVKNADGIIRRSNTRHAFHLLRTPSGWVIQEISE